MTLEEKIFKRAVINFSSLSEYGFIKQGKVFCLDRLFMNDAFRAHIKIDEAGNVFGDVYDVDTQDIYFPLRVDDMAAGFAGDVRKEYEKILNDIKQRCCVLNYFSGSQTNRISEKIGQIYGDKPEFPWEKYSDCGVFRHAESRKWYALVMNVDGAKFGAEQAGFTEIMNLKISEEKIPELLTQAGYFPAYHMNKKSWITLILNDTLSDEKIMELIAQSYAFAAGKAKKQRSKK